MATSADVSGPPISKRQRTLSTYSNSSTLSSATHRSKPPSTWSRLRGKAIMPARAGTTAIAKIFAEPQLETGGSEGLLDSLGRRGGGKKEQQEEMVVESTASPVPLPTESVTADPPTIVSEEPTPVVEEPAPVVEEPAPVVEPIIEKAAPIIEKAALTVEEPAPPTTTPSSNAASSSIMNWFSSSANTSRTSLQQTFSVPPDDDFYSSRPPLQTIPSIDLNTPPKREEEPAAEEHIPFSQSSITVTSPASPGTHALGLGTISVAAPETETSTLSPPMSPSAPPRRTRTLSTHSLNPSTSRFALRIPFSIPFGIGGSAAPTDSAKKEETPDKEATPKPSQTNTTEPPNEAGSTDRETTPKPTQTITAALPEPGSTSTITDSTPPPSEKETMTMVMEASISEDTIKAPPLTDSTTAENDDHLQTPRIPPIEPAAPDSWWDYVGWGGTVRAPPSADTTNTVAVDSKHDGVEQKKRPTHTPSSSVSVDSGVSDLPQPADTLPETPQTTENHESNMSTIGKSAGKKPTESVRSANSTGWYSAWAWYPYASTGAPEATAASGASASASGNGNGNGEEGKEELTDAEKVKEEALNRSDASPNLPSVVPSSSKTEAISPSETITETTPTPADTAPTSPSETNPISHTISSNRSGWTSFFSVSSASKVLNKRVRDQEHKQGEMEVMDIEDDDDSSPAAAAAGVTSSTMRADDNQVGKVKEELVKKEVVKKEETGKKKPIPPVTVPRPSSVPPPSAPIAIPSKKAPSPAASSPAPSPKSTKNVPVKLPPPPNLVLPTWADTFHALPRSSVPESLFAQEEEEERERPTSAKILKRAVVGYLSGFLGEKKEKAQENVQGKDKGKGRQKYHQASPLSPSFPLSQSGQMNVEEHEDATLGLPRAYDVIRNARVGIASGSRDGKPRPPMMDLDGDLDILRGCRRVVVIGVHGWFPGAVMRTVLGEPTGTSTKFVNMASAALNAFAQKHSAVLEKITEIPLEGEGTIGVRVDKLYKTLLANESWVQDIHDADAILVATHSQGSVVSTHLLDRLLRDGHIVSSVSASEVEGRKAQRVCCLALCGIHLGPLRYLANSSVLQPYFQYFESMAARELFEFQNTESEVSKTYVTALRNVVRHRTKMVYVASLNDQVVPIYSGLFTAANHPLILRALYIDGDAYHSSDFLSNLLVLLLRVLNAGLSDSGLIAHLSEATAGSLSGVGHSSVYEERGVYALAVNYLFRTDDGHSSGAEELVVEPFDAGLEQNDYEIPWSLRDVIANPLVSAYFSPEITSLREGFRNWAPKTTVLRDVKRKLSPITRLGSKGGSRL